MRNILHIGILVVSLAFSAEANMAPAQSTGERSAAVKIGGMNAIVLRRVSGPNNHAPQFLSITLLPGRAMNVFQITADLPGRGETNLILSPSLEEAAARLNDPTKDPWGDLSYSMGGAFLAPWASRVSGDVSADGQTVSTTWHGYAIHLRVNSAGRYAVHGLIHKMQVGEIHRVREADGERLTGLLHAGDFGGRWISSTDLYFSVSLRSDAVTLSVRAVNVGSEPEPMAIGWHPYFAIPSGVRSQVRVHVGADRYALTEPPYGAPTGKFAAVAGTEFDFRSPDGATLTNSLNMNLSDLRPGEGCEASLIDKSSRYGLCVQPLSRSIHGFQIYSPQSASFVAIEPQFNLPDAFGAEWKDTDTGVTVLKPGESALWSVRLAIFDPGGPRDVRNGR